MLVSMKLKQQNPQNIGQEQQIYLKIYIYWKYTVKL